MSSEDTEMINTLTNKVKNYKKENEYLLAKIHILTNSKNKGEKDEVLIVLELYNFNQENKNDKLIEIFGEEASEGISVINIDTNHEIIDINELSKTASCYKADCKIIMKKTRNVYDISIKSMNGAKPAILNHTPRTAKVFKEAGALYNCVPFLDKIIEEYMDKRLQKIIGEDICITNLDCLKEGSLLKEKFIEALIYFVFDGSGKGYSRCRANAIMTYEGNEITFYKCMNIENKKQYIESIYDKLVLSMRDKGMPMSMSEYNKPWTFEDIQENGTVKYKGSLHIRMN